MTQTVEYVRSATPPRGFKLQSLINLVLWPTIALGSIAFIEPSPSDLFQIILMVAWFLSGFTLRATLIPLIFIILVRAFSEIFALYPVMYDAEADSYVFYTAFCCVLCLFGAMFFSQNTRQRVEIMLSAYLASCIAASFFAYVGYFDIGGAGATFAPVGRALGSFKDPNVMGSYCVMGALYAFHLVLMKKTRHIFLASLAFLFISVAILLTFSRGSVAALVLCVLMLVGLSFFTTRSGLIRRRVALVFAVMVLLGGVVVLVLLSNSEFREVLVQRSTLVQDYDGGETGRFGNQIRSIPMLLDRLFSGFGPLQFRKVFDLEPHNSYISGFANAGLFGGFAFFALVLTTSFIGFRLCFKASPYQQYAMVMWPPMFGHFIQSFQIDTDHWRFMYLLLGAIWGLETARARWASAQAASDRVDLWASISA